MFAIHLTQRLIFAVICCGAHYSLLAASGGLTVLDISPDSEGQMVGMKAGDVLAGWSRGLDSGEFQSTYDLHQVETEQWPRGTVQMRGYRGSLPMTWELSEGEWRIGCRPAMPISVAESFEKAELLREAGKFSDAAEQFETAARLSSNRDQLLIGWLREQAARSLAQSRSWSAADNAYRATATLLRTTSLEAALQVMYTWAETFRERGAPAEAAKRYSVILAQRRLHSPASLALVAILTATGDAAMGREDYANAGRYFGEAAFMAQKLARKSLAAARILTRLGKIERRQGKLVAAEQHLRAALSILENDDHAELDRASALTGLGATEIDLSRYVDSEKHLKAALEIQRRRAPASAQLAATLNNLGLLSQNISDLPEADRYFQQALSINHTLAPGGIEEARNLSNLGMVANQRGDSAKAEDYLENSFEIQKKLAPNSISLATSLANLGAVYRDRIDLVAAESYYRQAQVILRRVAPHSPILPGLDLDLGDVALERGILPVADYHFRRALSGYQTLGHNTSDVAVALHALGLVAKRKGHLTEADGLYQSVTAIQKRLAPLGLDMAETLKDVGELAEARGNLAGARENYRAALAIRSKLTPNTTDEAECFYGLARIDRLSHDPVSAIKNFEAALAALESQAQRLGGSEEIRARFGAKNSVVYRAYMDMLVERGEFQNAFYVLERSRGRDLLRMLAERDLVFPNEIPSDLQKRLSSNAAEYDRVQRQIKDLDPVSEAEQVSKRVNRLRELTAERTRIDDQIKQSSPRLAGLKYPKPLNAAEAAVALDPGTLLLSYAVGAKRTSLFVLGASGAKIPLREFPLPLGEATLRSRIRRFRKQIETPVPVNSDLRQTAQNLYRDLSRAGTGHNKERRPASDHSRRAAPPPSLRRTYARRRILDRKKTVAHSAFRHSVCGDPKVATEFSTSEFRPCGFRQPVVPNVTNAATDRSQRRVTSGITARNAARRAPRQPV